MFLNLEVAATPAMLEVTKQVKPDLCTLVPEGREELTTERGLTISTLMSHTFQEIYQELIKSQIPVSFFLDPDIPSIDATSKMNCRVIELHSGYYANAQTKKEQQKALNTLRSASKYAHKKKMNVCIGHGLNKVNLPPILYHVPHIHSVSIGHALICDSLEVGFSTAIKHYCQILSTY